MSVEKGRKRICDRCGKNNMDAAKQITIVKRCIHLCRNCASEVIIALTEDKLNFDDYDSVKEYFKSLDPTIEIKPAKRVKKSDAVWRADSGNHATLTPIIEAPDTFTE